MTVPIAPLKRLPQRVRSLPVGWGCRGSSLRVGADDRSSSTPCGGALPRLLCLIALATLASSACSKGPARHDIRQDEIECTEELRIAVVVRVSSPTRGPVTAVTVFNQTELPCRASPRTNPTPPAEYLCFEQGGGRYVVHVRRGPTTWTQVVSIDADECHVTRRETVDFWLDPTVAD